MQKLESKFAREKRHNKLTYVQSDSFWVREMNVMSTFNFDIAEILAV